MAEATEKSGFFDSVNGDRLYSAADFNKLLGSVYDDGIRREDDWHPSTNLKLRVTKVSGSMSVHVAPGSAIFRGRWYELGDDGDYKTLQLDAADPNYPRIDCIYIRFDGTSRSAYLAVKKGTPAASPTYYFSNDMGLLLATARIEAGATSIASVTDMRYTSHCGFATLIDAPNIVQEWEYIAPASKTSATSFTVSEIESQIHSSGDVYDEIYKFRQDDIFFVTVNGLDLPRAEEASASPATGTWCYYSNSIRIGTDAAPSKGDVVRIRIMRRVTIGHVDD